MNKEKAKDLLPVIQAYSEGKIIQVERSDGSWEDCEDLDFCLSPENYRIKPESEYRPYESCDEMIADFKTRFNTTVPSYITVSSYTMPIIWIKHKIIKNVLMITGFEYCIKDLTTCFGVYVGDLTIDFEDLFNNWTYLDDSPCGVKE